MDLVERALRAHPAQFGKILENAADFRFQVLCSEVDKDGNLVRHGFRADSEYFYPASTIKLCAAVAALQKLKHIRRSLGIGVSCTTPLAFHPFQGGDLEQADASNLNGHKITVGHELRKLFLVSDNEAFNRLYDFVGHRFLNQAMWDINLPSTRLRHHLSKVSSSGGSIIICRPIELEATASIPPKKSLLEVPANCSMVGLKVGNAYMTADKNLVNEPMNFSSRNCMSLLDLQNFLIKITRPDLQIDKSPLELDQDSVILLMEAMSQYPAASCNPRYSSNVYPDDYCKFFLPGLCRVRSKGALRVYNKVGRGFGFTTDNAYIFDIETGRSFFLSATLYTNANGIVDDDVYEYQSIADRVMADLAEVIARAVWQIPPTFTNLSTPFDCVPSSLWEQVASNSDAGNSTLELEEKEEETVTEGVDFSDNLVSKAAAITLNSRSLTGLESISTMERVTCKARFRFFVDQ